MRYLPTNVRGTTLYMRGYGYLVTMPDGSEEWYRLAWQATARAHGWAPPADLMAQAREAVTHPVAITGGRGVMTEQERDQLARETAERIVDYITADADPEEGSWGVQGIAQIVRKTIDQTLRRAARPKAPPIPG